MLRTYTRRKPETVLAPKAAVVPATKGTLPDKENASANLQNKLMTTKPTKQETVVEKPREVKRSRPQDKRAPLGNLLGPPPTKRSKVEVPAAKPKQTAAAQTKKPVALKQTAMSSIEEYLALKKAEFDDIDKFQLDEISYSIDDERSVDSSVGQSDALNREIIEVSSAIGSIFDSISIDASSKLIDDTPQDELPDFETMSNIPPLASSNDDFEQKQQKRTERQRPAANRKSPAAAPKQPTRSTRRSNPTHEAKNDEADLESFVFGHFVQPAIGSSPQRQTELSDVPSPIKDGDLPFFAMTPAAKLAATTSRRTTRRQSKLASAASPPSSQSSASSSATDFDLERLIFDQFVQPKSAGEQ